jgi:DNA topoisomerase-3
MHEAGQPAVDFVAHAGRDPQRLRYREAGQREYEPLADAARGRSRADWLVGMNLSRAYTLTYGDRTLAWAACRRRRSRWWWSGNWRSGNFVPEDYLEVIATFRPAASRMPAQYKGTWVRDTTDLQKSMRLPATGDAGVEAAQIVERARAGAAAIESMKAETQRMGPPLLYDLTELQRHANRLFGFSAQKTLDTRRLVRTHKLISYPAHRQPLSFAGRGGDAAADRGRRCSGPYREHAGAGHGRKPAGPKVCGRREGHAITTPLSPR